MILRLEVVPTMFASTTGVEQALWNNL